TKSPASPRSSTSTWSARRSSRSPLPHAGVEGGAAALALTGDLLPVVRAGLDAELGGRRRATDPDQAQLHPEETHVVVGVLVQPVEHGPVLLAEPGDDPDHRGEVQPGSVGEVV